MYKMHEKDCSINIMVICFDLLSQHNLKLSYKNNPETPFCLKSYTKIALNQNIKNTSKILF